MAEARKFDFSNRFKAAAIHFGISALIGVIVAIVVFGFWYPWPFRAASGGQALFVLVVSVDLVLGPALTFVVFDSTKRRSVLMRDLMVIAILQLGGLAYGLNTVYLARPVAIVFENRRFRVVPNVDVVHGELAQSEIQTLPLTGPIYLGTRKPKNSAENLDAIMKAIDGTDIGRRPLFWQSYAKSVDDIVANSRPLSLLYKRYPASKREIDQAIEKTGRKQEDLKFLPVITKSLDWCVVVDGKTGAVVTYLPYDGFF